MSNRKIAKTKIAFHDKAPNCDINMNINLGRFEQQFAAAQYFLDSQIMTDMVPYMPMQTGTFVDVTRGKSAAIAGSGQVVAAAPPMGRYLYEGKVMVDSVTGKGPMKIPDGPVGAYVLRFRKGAKLMATERDLEFSTAANPKAHKKWFDEAKRAHGSEWIRQTKVIAGGGGNG